MPHAIAGPEHKTDWEKTLHATGYCEVTPDAGNPRSAASFRDWAMKNRLACVEGERLVALSPKAFSPKDSLDRGRYSFLARYFRPREAGELEDDLRQAFGIRSQHVLAALQRYWMTERVISETGGQVQADRDLLRLMGFSYLELMQALDGVVKKEYLQAIPSGHKLADANLTVEYGRYLINFEIVKERFFDSRFLLQVSGQPIALTVLGRMMGVDDMDDLRRIMKEAKKRWDLNLEFSDEHVMFGAPSPGIVEGLAHREKEHKAKLSETETVLKGRLGTIKQLLSRYSSREAQILNETESLKEEGRMLYVKSKIVTAVKQQIEGRGR